MALEDSLLPKMSQGEGGRKCCACNRRCCCKFCLASVVAFLLVLSTSIIFAVDEKHFHSLMQEVEIDGAHIKLLDHLLSYAKEQVAEHKEAIKVNMDKHSIDKIDSIYPGNGYNSVAYGGSYEVLTLLEKEGIVKVGNIMGGSGGAASALLALSDTSAKKLIKYYMVYALWLSRSWDVQALQTTNLWRFIYEDAISDADSFNRVQERNYVVTKCGWPHFLVIAPTQFNYVLHNFSSSEQCVQSLQASGACSVKAYTKGLQVDKVSSKFGACSDAAAVTYFPKSSGALLYYNAFYGYASSCTFQSIEELIKAGVDATIATLASHNLTTDDMQVLPPGPGGKVSLKDFRNLKSKFVGPLYSYLALDETFVDLGHL